MSKKKLIISVLCMALLSVMPVQAAVDICIHPVLVGPNEAYHWYDITTDQHQEWWQEVIERCKKCGADVTLGPAVSGAWEDHHWRILSSESGNTGQTVHDVVCIVCNYEDVLITYYP